MRKRYSSFLIAFGLMIFVFILAQHLLMMLIDKNIMTVTDGFDVTMEGSASFHAENVNVERLREAGMPTVRAGDTVTVTCTIPDFEAAAFPTIMFQSRFSAVELYVDDVFLTSCEMEELEEGDVVCSGIYMTDLPADYAGRTLKMVYHAARDRAFYNIAGPRFGASLSLIRAYNYRRIIPYVMGVFLVVYGAILIIMMTVYVSYLQRFEHQIVTGMLCAVLGIWIITSNRMTLFVAPSIHAMEWEYISLTLIPPLIYLYLIGMPKPGSRKLFFAMAILSTVICVSFVVMHFLGVVHIVLHLPGYFLVALAVTVLSIYYLADIVRNGKIDTSEGVRMGGIMAIAIMNIIHTVISIGLDYFGFYRSVLSYDIFSIGAAFFVMTQMVDYFIYITGYYAKKEENLTLSDIAYIDSLTGLSNRAEWDVRMKELADFEREYCIFSLDLNGLKEINDTAGHARGDKLLTDVAQAIREAFREEDFCARIGGDEFVVIMEDATEWQAQTHVRYLERRLKDLDRKERDVNHSCAVGYAFKHEGATPHEVYLLADTKMYDEKARQKTDNRIRSVSAEA